MVEYLTELTFLQLLSQLPWRKEDLVLLFTIFVRKFSGQCLHLIQQKRNPGLPIQLALSPAFFFPPNFHLYAKIKYFLSPLLIVQGILFSMLHVFCIFFSLSSNQLLSTELQLNSVKAPQKERGLTVTYQKPSWTCRLLALLNARADKKTSYDSAALAMLNELQKRGQVIIGESI